MRSFVWIAAVAALGLVFIGCGGEEEDHHGGGEDVTVPDHYAHAVEKCEKLSKEIDDLIRDDKLDKVHAVAKSIQMIAEKLAELAKKDLPAEMLKDVNVKAKELAGTFSEIDTVADAGDKEGTIKVHNKIKELIGHLKEHAGHAKEKEHHDD